MLAGKIKFEIIALPSQAPNYHKKQLTTVYTNICFQVFNAQTSGPHSRRPSACLGNRQDIQTHDDSFQGSLSSPSKSTVRSYCLTLTILATRAINQIIIHYIIYCSQKSLSESPNAIHVYTKPKGQIIPKTFFAVLDDSGYKHHKHNTIESVVGDMTALQVLIFSPAGMIPNWIKF